MQKETLITILNTINPTNVDAFTSLVALLKKGLEEASAGGHEWPHRWPCDGARLIDCEYIYWDQFYEQIIGDKPQIQFEENKKGDIIISLTFSFDIGLENEYIPVPGKKFLVEYWDCDEAPFWGTSGHWAKRKVPTKMVTAIFRNIEGNYVLGTMFPGPCKDPGDYSGFDKNRRTEISAEEVMKRKLNFRIAEIVTSSPLIDNFIKNLKLVDKNGVEHKLLPVEE